MDDHNVAEMPRRRVVLAGIGVAGVAAVTLAGCGSSGGSPSGSGNPTGGGATGAGTPANPSTTAGGQASAIKTSDIPSGGGKIFADQNVVVTQPTAGNFKAFSATCTHQGCQVTKVENGTIGCPCHGSQFSIADGSVKAGPAPTPLPAKTVSVSGGSILVS